MNRAAALLALVASCIGLPSLGTGCALFTRGAKLQVAYYDPLPPAPASATPPASGCTMAIGRVRGSEALRREIEYRSAPNLVGYYDARRWTEPPDAYLARAIDRALFESGLCQRSESNLGLTLDATLIAFEECRAPEGARVAVHVVLHDGETVLWDATIESDRPASGSGEAGDRFAGVARAMGDALGQVVERIAQHAEAAVRARVAR